MEGSQSDMSWSRNIRSTCPGIPDRGLSTNEVSDMASICSKQDIRGGEGTSFGSPSGIAKDHPIVDDREAATALGSSSRKSTAWERSQANTLRVKALTVGPDKGKGPKAEPSGPGTQVPPTSATSQGNRLITASDFKALLENINQKIDGMTAWLSTIEQRMSTAPQDTPQPQVRESLTGVYAYHRPSALRNEHKTMAIHKMA